MTERCGCEVCVDSRTMIELAECAELSLRGAGFPSHADTISALVHLVKERVADARGTVQRVEDVVERHRKAGYLKPTVAALNDVLLAVYAPSAIGLPECICSKCGLRHGGTSFDPEVPF